MDELRRKRCKPCEGGVTPLDGAAARALLGRVHADWTLVDNDKTIVRDVRFRGFNRAMGFANAVAWVAMVEGHHPDISVGYGYCRVRYTTHAIRGLSENDFICASKIDALLEEDDEQGVAGEAVRP